VESFGSDSDSFVLAIGEDVGVKGAASSAFDVPKLGLQLELELELESSVLLDDDADSVVTGNISSFFIVSLLSRHIPPLGEAVIK
jgi:hypothetical protein